MISRSTFPGSGKHTGHWTGKIKNKTSKLLSIDCNSGDNHSTWQDMIQSISGMLNFQMFGIPLVGSDIGGFLGKYYKDLVSHLHHMAEHQRLVQ